MPGINTLLLSTGALGVFLHARGRLSRYTWDQRLYVVSEPRETPCPMLKARFLHVAIFGSNRDISLRDGVDYKYTITITITNSKFVSITISITITFTRFRLLIMITFYGMFIKIIKE